MTGILVFAAAALLSAGPEGAPQPNVVIVLADDLGLGDLSCYGGKTPTPNLDRMAKEGVRFTQYYAASPICSPSRCALITGQHPGRWRITSFLQTRAGNMACGQNDFLDPNAPSLARILRAAGYCTAHIGKWHLGGGRDVTVAPKFAAYGYDLGLGTWESPEPHANLTARDWIWSPADRVKRWDRTSWMVDRTLDFLRDHPDRPCFVNLWLDDPHAPWVPTADDQQVGKDGRGVGKGDTPERLAQVLTEMDRQVGRLLDGLRERQAERPTLVLFLSDNGPLPTFDRARTVGLRGSKLSLYEGGVRVPCIAWGPRLIPNGITNEATVLAAVDLYPTLGTLCQAPLPKEYTSDGEDLSPALLGKVVARTKMLFWEYGRNDTSFAYPKRDDRSPAVAVREGDWKLLVNAEGSGAELYDLAADPREAHNLAAARPEVTRRLSAAAVAWRKLLPSAAGDALEFRPVAGFLKLPDDMKLGPCSGVDIDSQGNVYVIQRKAPPILCFDSSGRLLRSWGTSLIGRDPNMQGAHGIRVDKDDFVWITDRDRHLVRKFDTAGQLLLTLGTEGFAGTGPNQFNRPADVAIGKSGEVYVADGYGNSRVMKFDRDGKLLKTWGEAGSGPGQFNLPHTIAVGADGRVYVGDRYNERIQIFDSDGKLKEIWRGFIPCGIAFDRMGNLFVADGVSKVLQIDNRGKVVNSWGMKAEELGLKPGQKFVPAIANPGGFRFVPHLLAADAQGSLYLADVSNQILHKLERQRASNAAEVFDIVLSNGRIIDPESGLDAVGHVGIRGDKIAAISTAPLQSKTILDVRGLVVAPGFIDLHAHGQELPAARMQACDGVTTHLELESGILPVSEYYERRAREGRPINYGVSSGWAFARVAVLEKLEPTPDLRFISKAFALPTWTKKPANEEQTAAILARVEQGLKEGAIGIGMLAGYAPGFGHKEHYAIQKLAARHGVPTFIHVRFMGLVEPDSSFAAYQEVVAMAAATGAHVHICHFNSTSLRDIEICARLIADAQKRGLRITTEAYPYGTGWTGINAAFLNRPDWRERMGMDYSDLVYLKTGERLTRERMEELKKSDPGGSILLRFLDPDAKPRDQALLDQSVLFPGGAIASDGGDWEQDGKVVTGDVWPLPLGATAHPRAAGTFCRVVGRYVRERKALNLSDAIKRCTLIPAQILEASVPQMKHKGRLKVGADADVVVFDPETVLDRATYEKPAQTSAGIRHVLVNGTPVLRDGELIRTALPGRPIRR